MVNRITKTGLIGTIGSILLARVTNLLEAGKVKMKVITRAASSVNLNLTEVLRLSPTIPKIKSLKMLTREQKDTLTQ